MSPAAAFGDFVTRTFDFSPRDTSPIKDSKPLTVEERRSPENFQTNKVDQIDARQSSQHSREASPYKDTRRIVAEERRSPENDGTNEVRQFDMNSIRQRLRETKEISSHQSKLRTRQMQKHSARETDRTTELIIDHSRVDEYLNSKRWNEEGGIDEYLSSNHLEGTQNRVLSHKLKSRLSRKSNKYSTLMKTKKKGSASTNASYSSIGSIL